ncbi:MAG: PAS domain-containing protein [Xanthobacteraceae bacterium]|nr:PAS domain-containing protein [Bradyrhizobium sp.]
MSVRFGGKLDTYQTLLLLEERLGFGLFTWDIDADELQWSDGLFALFGLKPGIETPTRALALSMTHPDDRLSTGWIRHEVREGRLLDRDFRVILRDGRVRHISQLGWLTGGDDNNTHLAGVCVDVTPLFEARLQSELVQRRFKELVNAASCVVWMAPPDDDGLQANRLMSAEGLDANGDWLDRVFADDKAALLANWSRAAASQKPFKFLHRIMESDGSSRWYRSHAVPLRDRDSSVIEWIGVTIDVHDLIAGTQETLQITGAQIRGGRGILNWSVRDLANATGLTIGVIRRLEEFDGTSTGYNEALSVILRTMEAAGVEFLMLPNGKPAVRPR